MANMTGGTADCFRCEDEEKEAKRLAGASWTDLIYRDFIVCGICGNKRCPQASDHRNECTGSNEPGQPGSIYGKPRNLTKEEREALIKSFLEGED